MKNSFSKTLICAVVASSFILINCQKSPAGGGVRGTRSGTDDAKVATPEQAVPENNDSLLIKCSPEFIAQYKIWSDSVESKEVKAIRSLKKEDLIESQKQDLNLLVKRLDNETKSVRVELNKMQDGQPKTDETSPTKNIQGCFSGEGKDRTEYLISKIEENTNKTSQLVADLTGEETPRAQTGREEAKQREEKKLNESNVTKNAHFYVASEMNEVLDDTKIDETFFMDGKILSGENNLNKAKDNKAQSVCYTLETAGKIEDLSNSLDSLSTEMTEKIAGKTSYKIRFVSGSRLYTLGCSLPNDIKINDGFHAAFGDLLMTKKQMALKEKTVAIEKLEAQDAQDKPDAEKKSIAKISAEIKKDKMVEKQKLTEKLKKEFYDEDVNSVKTKKTEKTEKTEKNKKDEPASSQQAELLFT